MLPVTWSVAWLIQIPELLTSKQIFSAIVLRVSNLADAAILRANGSGRAVERQVLSGTASGIQVNVIQGYRDLDSPDSTCHFAH